MTNARNARNAREKAAAMRAEAARREARRRTFIVTVSVIAALAVLIVAGVIVQMARQESLEASGSTPPRNLTNGTFVQGKADAPVTITIYADFICPGCKMFEESTKAQLDAWTAAGVAKVEHRTIALLDQYSTDDYSPRATTAPAAVIDLKPDSYLAFQQALFANQPAEGGPGLPDSTLVELATAAGAPEAKVRDAIEKRSFRGWVASAAEEASKSGIHQTPTVLVNGTKLEQNDPASLTTAVEAAAKAAGTTLPTVSPTPSPTASPSATKDE